MKLSKCENGHFFDSDKYPECPYCNPALKSGGGSVQTQDAAAPEAVPSGPVAGWLVVTEGPGRGRDLRLGEGRSFLGTGADGAPCLLSADAPLSARVAAVAYDPKDGSFTLVPGSASELCYQNGQRLLVPQPLAAGDTLALGKASLRFVPFCGEFRW